MFEKFNPFKKNEDVELEVGGLSVEEVEDICKQAGVSESLLTEESLNHIHQRLNQYIIENGVNTHNEADFNELVSFLDRILEAKEGAQVEGVDFKMDKSTGAMERME